VHRLLADPRQAQVLKPFLQLGHVFVAHRPRDGPVAGVAGLGRERQGPHQHGGLHHFVEGEDALNTRIGPQRDHRVGQVGEDVALFID
jgi:hypothetical protein